MILDDKPVPSYVWEVWENNPDINKHTMDLRNPGLPKSSKKPGRKHSDFDLDPNPAVALLDLE